MDNTQQARQEDRAVALLRKRGMMRLSEFLQEDITAATISRMEEKGALLQLSRGLYQLPDAPLDANHTLAEAAKLIPNGVICLDSALAFHGLTDRIPPSVSVAIGPRAWRPKITQPRVLIVRYTARTFDDGIDEHSIERVPVRIYSPAKTIVDMFYHGRIYKSWYGSERGLTEAVQAMKEALRQQKATPADIARFAAKAGMGIWEKIVQPRLEVLTVDA
jgi:predicted transcriptional regulator of viral defense system